jgi:predicted PurR-regulated permease PerM
MNDISNRRRYYRSAFILFLTISVTMLFIFMVRDFLIAILLAGIFSGLLFPVYNRLLRIPVLQKRPGITSALLLVVVLITIGIPLTGLLGIVTSEAFQISENVTPWIQQNLLPQLNASVLLPEWLPFAGILDPYKEVILSKLGEATSATGNFLVRSGSALTQGTASFLLKLFVMIYAMFFFFLRGPEWINKFAGYLPLSTEDRNQVINRGLTVTSASLKGILGIGLLQGFLVGLAFMIIGIQGAAFWGTIVMILSAVPGIGPPLVWVPAAMYLYLTDQTGWAIGLTIWGILVVGTVDNVLRQRIVGSQAKIPDLLILLGTLGGIVMFGAIGIIIGPIVIAGLVAILDIYQHAFVRHLPANEDTATQVISGLKP